MYLINCTNFFASIFQNPGISRHPGLYGIKIEEGLTRPKRPFGMKFVRVPSERRDIKIKALTELKNRRSELQHEVPASTPRDKAAIVQRSLSEAAIKTRQL